jgi:hypothetical protein
MYAAITEGAPVKTTAADGEAKSLASEAHADSLRMLAKQDVEIFTMIMDAMEA